MEVTAKFNCLGFFLNIVSEKAHEWLPFGMLIHGGL